jgi:hypothetical protein
MTRITVVAVGLILVAGVPAVAGNWQPAMNNPYSKLFQPAPLPAAKTEAPKPRVVCGMTVVPADPRLDARMLVEMKKKDTRYTMRVIPPPICR